METSEDRDQSLQVWARRKHLTARDLELCCCQPEEIGLYYRMMAIVIIVDAVEQPLPN
jgi:hypothetical protein